MRNYLIYLLTALILPQLIYGQDVIQLPGVGNRSIEPAYRMTQNPSVIDTVIASNVVEYPLMMVQRQTSIMVTPIEPATVKTETKLDQLYHSYVKLGIGSKLMPLGELYYDSKRSRKYQFGIHAKHLSSFGNVSGYAPAQFDRTGSTIYGAINERKYSLSGNAFYNNQGLHYYGWPLTETWTPDSVDRNTIAQRFQHTGGAVRFSSHLKDSASFNYHVGVNYHHFNSKKPSDSLAQWRAKENNFGFNSGFVYRSGKEVYNLDLDVNYNGYTYGSAGDTAMNSLDTGIVRNNTVVGLKPRISTYMKGDRFRALIGADVLLDVADETKVYVYPAAELKYSMFNDIFIPYAGLRGGLRQMTFQSLVSENEFVLTNVNMRNENKVIDFYGGIKGTLSKRISFNFALSFARIRDKAFFINDTTYSTGNKFGLIYDTLNLATLEGSISYQLREKLKIDAIGKFYSYELSNQLYAWNLPVWQLSTRGSYNLFEKFIVNADVHVEGGRKSLLLTNDSIPIEEKFNDLGLIVDVNLCLEYRYNKRISAFIQFNNIASQRYLRWYNYPVQTFQLLGGVTARF